ncbi:MAG: lysoplasmalogenase [Oscillospiraceae bacterium]|jgi:uncharacterized membrane protein YhhN|nr:lysoplasmalogenase [Oscillospiraceae bacterium]
MLFWKLLFTGTLFAATLALAVTRHAAVYWLALAAVAFSWLGDATLGGFKPLTGYLGDPSLFGLGFFAAGHLCYIAAFAAYLRLWPQPGFRTLAMVAAFAAAAAALWYFLCWQSGQAVPLRVASLAYALVIFIMAGMAWSSAARLVGTVRFIWPLALGSVLFIISDGLIALDWFRDWSFPWQGAAVWATYAPAQSLLVIGFWMTRAPQAAAALETIGL